MQLLFRPILLPVVLSLAACGGGVSVGAFDDDPWLDFSPVNTGRAGTLTVAGAGDTALNGPYTSNDAAVSPVLRFFGQPATCRFRFTGYVKGGGIQRELRGEVHYVVDTAAHAVSFFTIGGFEYRADGSGGVTVDRTANQVNYTNAVFTSTQFGSHVTVSGTIPLHNATRPSGC